MRFRFPARRNPSPDTLHWECESVKNESGHRRPDFRAIGKESPNKISAQALSAKTAKYFRLRKKIRALVPSP